MIREILLYTTSHSIPPTTSVATPKVTAKKGAPFNELAISLAHHFFLWMYKTILVEGKKVHPIEASLKDVARFLDWLISLFDMLLNSTSNDCNAI